MLTSELKSKIDALWQTFWANGMSNHIVAIEHMSYLIFMKRLEDLENDRIIAAKRTGKKYSSVFDGKEEMRWSIWQNYEGEKMLKHVTEKIFPFIKNMRGEESYFTEQMKNANFEIKSASLLQGAVNMIESMRITQQNQDVQGDIYEHLLSKLEQAGLNGQFRTPRHIIRMMVELLDPKLYQKICDPACGSAGFLINAYQHILKEYTSEDLIEYDEEKVLHHLIGDKLTEKERLFLIKDQFYGFEFDNTMVRIATMNMILHGFEEPNIRNQDTLNKSFKEKEKYHVVFANPPFAGNVNKSEISDNFEIITTKTELLFLELFYNLLMKGGQAAVIVPDGALTSVSTAHVKIRQMMLENCRVDAIVSMPSGVFKPYTGVSTSVILFTKGEKTKDIWFYRMENDGYALDEKRTKIEKNDIPDIIEKFKKREISEKSWIVTFDEIKNNDWNISASRYRPYVKIEVKREDPKKIMNEILKLENDIDVKLKELKDILKNA
ncbi:MAG: class I SAM-dependent DNA methyltransferase [Nitrosotalea sp.]